MRARLPDVRTDCKYCKCRDCTFCAKEDSGSTGTSSVSSSDMAAAQTALQSELPPATGGARNATRKKRRHHETNADGAAANKDAAPSASDDTPRKQCRSDLKGDFNYEYCGGFCKASKASNHCRFCKCKACQFCGGAPAAAAKPAAAATTTATTADAGAGASPASTSAAPAAEAPSVARAPHARHATYSHSDVAAAADSPAASAVLRPYAPGSGRKPTVHVPSTRGARGADASQMNASVTLALWAALICCVGGAGAWLIDSALSRRGGFVSSGGSGERSAFLRGHQRHDQDSDTDDARLEDDFRNVEKLEESLNIRKAPTLSA